MLTFRSGDLFDSTAVALVNPVNCVGVMGAGLALEFKRRFPAAFVDYQAACKSGSLRIGKVHVSITSGEPERYVIHFPTKNHLGAATLERRPSIRKTNELRSFDLVAAIA
jgi:O-acetyl-ADP-ribose deacetylase (regulator of RNase III)